MPTEHNPINELYSLSEEKSYDANISRKERNALLIGFFAGESILALVNIIGVDVHPVLYGVVAFNTVMPAGMCEFSRRNSLWMSRDFREGARECVELEIIMNDTVWGQTLEEPRNTEPPTVD